MTVAQRIVHGPTLANPLIDEAATLLLTGQLYTAPIIPRNSVNATVDFETLDRPTAKLYKSLHRKPSSNGSLGMVNPGGNLLQRIARKTQGGILLRDNGLSV